MELTDLIAALQQEVDKRRTVDEAAAKLAKALGVEAHDQGLNSIERTIRDIGVDRARRLRPITPIPISEGNSATDSENGSGEPSPSQSA